MTLPEPERETQALLANELRVLASDLNKTILRAAANSLRVNLEVRETIDVVGPATRYPELTIRILAEVK